MRLRTNEPKQPKSRFSSSGYVGSADLPTAVTRLSRGGSQRTVLTRGLWGEQPPAGRGAEPRKENLVF